MSRRHHRASAQTTKRSAGSSTPRPTVPQPGAAAAGCGGDLRGAAASHGARGRRRTALTTVVVPVAGMTCRTCEIRIERFVGRLRNVERVSASSVRARVEVVASGPIGAPGIEGAIVAAGYEVGQTPWIERDTRVWATAGAGVPSSRSSRSSPR